MDSITATISTAVIPLSAIVGGKAASIIASASTLPPWISELLGPFGFLIGMLIAISWLTRKLDRQERKADEREAKREIDIASLATMAANNQTVIEQNSKMLQDSTWAIEKCRQCDMKIINLQK